MGNRCLRWIVFPAVVMLLTLAVSACGVLGRGTNYGNSLVFNNNASVFVVCSPLCEARGHCGTVTEDGAQMFTMLFSRGGPSTQNFDALLSHNQPVTVLESREEAMIMVSSRAQFAMRFYRVQSQQTTPPVDGWTPGFCVADQTINR